MISVFLLTWFVLATLNEVPNVYSWEWIYCNIPFTRLELFKINIIIFTFGWFFLIVSFVKYIELVKLVFKLETTSTVK